jgi:hypothetical protein
VASPTVYLDGGSYDCERGFRWSVGIETAYLPRDQAVAAAITILKVAFAFGGLSGTDRVAVKAIAGSEPQL